MGAIWSVRSAAFAAAPMAVELFLFCACAALTGGCTTGGTSRPSLRAAGALCVARGAGKGYWAEDYVEEEERKMDVV